MNLTLFMNVFLYELEQKLNQNLNYFDDVQFQFDEANADQQIKIKIKEYILENFKKIESVKEVSQDGNTTVITESAFEIIDVKILGELTEEDRRFIKDNRNSVYTNPDLLFIIKENDKTHKIPVEVKSTKNNKIPGSSIQQIDSDDLVIFIKHNDTQVLKVVTGKYIDSVSGTIQFPDRSPRPQVSFNNLDEWNNNYRNFKNGKLEFGLDRSLNERLDILKDWQLLLANRWIDMLSKPKKNNGEPWFNNNLRKFTLLLLNLYDNLSNEEKEKYKEIINNNTVGDNSDE